MGLRAYKYYTTTPPFVINKLINKRQKERDEKNIVRKFNKIENISSKAKSVQKHKYVQKHKH